MKLSSKYLSANPTFDILDSCHATAFKLKLESHHLTLVLNVTGLIYYTDDLIGLRFESLAVLFLFNDGYYRPVDQFVSFITPSSTDTLALSYPALHSNHVSSIHVKKVPSITSFTLLRLVELRQAVSDLNVAIKSKILTANEALKTNQSVLEQGARKRRLKRYSLALNAQHMALVRRNASCNDWSNLVSLQSKECRDRISERRSKLDLLKAQQERNYSELNTAVHSLELIKFYFN